MRRKTIVVAPTTTNAGNDNAGDADDAAAVAIVRAKCGFRDNKGSNMQLLRRRCCQGTIPILRQQKDWVGEGKKMTVFADIQYCVYADIVDALVRKCPNIC